MQWKRRRGDELDPSTLWLERPATVDDGAALARYRGMGYGGVARVALVHPRPPGLALLDGLARLWKHAATPPAVECVAAQSSFAVPRTVAGPTVKVGGGG